MIFEGLPEQNGVAVEISVASDLGPGRIDAKRDDRQQDVDDPDAEIFLGAAGK
jgi:hypothetical protein